MGQHLMCLFQQLANFQPHFMVQYYNCGGRTLDNISRGYYCSVIKLYTAEYFEKDGICLHITV